MSLVAPCFVAVRSRASSKKPTACSSPPRAAPTLPPQRTNVPKHNAPNTTAGTPPRVAEAPAAFVFHHANAFQTATTTGADTSASTFVTLDTVAWDTLSFENNQYTLTPDYYKGGARSQLRRYVFDLGPLSAPSAAASAAAAASGAAPSAAPPQQQQRLPARLVSDTRLLRRCAEFPSVAPRAAARAARHVYCCADAVDDDVYWGPAQCVAKVTIDPAAGLEGPFDASAAGGAVAVDLWAPGARCVVNEPLFVPRKGEPNAHGRGGWMDEMRG